MELFQNADYVRLQSPVHGKYIHAAEDGRTVCLDALQTSHNAVWAVELRQFAGVDYVLLRGAYGRYLGASDFLSRLFPCPWVAARQLDFDEPEKKEIMWQVSRTAEGTVKLKSASGPFLCPGIYFYTHTKAREWKVHEVPKTFIMPPAPPHCVDKWRFSLEREIYWVLANRSGAINDDCWGSFLFVGRDKSALEEQFKLITENFPMSLFVRAGCHGTVTPLCVNLPRSREPIDIIGLWGKAATKHLVFPMIHKVADVESPGAYHPWKRGDHTGSLLVDEGNAHKSCARVWPGHVSRDEAETWSNMV